MRSSDIGIGTRIAILAFETAPDNPYASNSDEKARQGNGSLMRLAPIIARFYTRPVECLQFAADSSRYVPARVRMCACVHACVGVDAYECLRLFFKRSFLHVCVGVCALACLCARVYLSSLVVYLKFNFFFTHSSEQHMVPFSALMLASILRAL